MNEQQQIALFKHLPTYPTINPNALLKKHVKKKQSVLQKRIYAFYIDFFTSILFAKSTVISYWATIKITFPALTEHFQLSMLKNIAGTEMAMIILAFFAQHFISHTIGNGQTLGKYLMNLRTINPERPAHIATLKESLSRSFLLTSSIFALPFLIAMPFLREDRQGIHCWLSGLQTFDNNFYKELKQAYLQKISANVWENTIQINMSLTQEMLVPEYSDKKAA